MFINIGFLPIYVPIFDGLIKIVQNNCLKFVENYKGLIIIKKIKEIRQYAIKN